MAEPIVSNISDTARWVAAYRAHESARPDRLFNDPLADKLAGDKGAAIAAAITPAYMRGGWPIVMRTKVMDDMVLASMREGCDLVINLAAGLDTRPYRLALPPELLWIEADLPGLIEEKSRVLEGETPVCQLRREAIDLKDAVATGEFLDRVTLGASRALVITEGLLLYLEEDAVRALGQAFASRPEIRWWMLEIVSPTVLKMMQWSLGKKLAKAPFKFAPANGVAFIEALGWKAIDIYSLGHEAARSRRAPFSLWLYSKLSKPDPRNLGHSRWSGAARFERRA